MACMVFLVERHWQRRPKDGRSVVEGDGRIIAVLVLAATGCHVIPRYTGDGSAEEGWRDFREKGR